MSQYADQPQSIGKVLDNGIQLLLVVVDDRTIFDALLSSFRRMPE